MLGCLSDAATVEAGLLLSSHCFSELAVTQHLSVDQRLLLYAFESKEASVMQVKRPAVCLQPLVVVWDQVKRDHVLELVL
jgi:hypothetical protein